MDKNPLISIIVPVYQAENSIENTINNLECQTYNNLEIICIDDGSTDKSYEICEKLKNKYPNLRLFKNTKNQGVEFSRNFGINSAKGEFFTFVDADDTINVDMISKLYSAIASSKADLVLSGYTAVHFDKSVKHLAQIKTGSFSAESLVNYLFSEFPLDILSCIGGRLYRTAFVKENHLCFDIQYKFNEDLAFAIDVVSCANKITYVNECYYYYLISSSGTTMSSKRNNMFESMIKVLENLKNLFIKFRAYETKKEHYLLKVFVLFLSSLLNEAKYGTYKSFSKLLRNIRSYQDYFDVYRFMKTNNNNSKKHKIINKCIYHKMDAFLYLAFLTKRGQNRF